jgi:hypothetical protein
MEKGKKWAAPAARGFLPHKDLYHGGVDPLPDPLPNDPRPKDFLPEAGVDKINDPLDIKYNIGTPSNKVYRCARIYAYQIKPLGKLFVAMPYALSKNPNTIPTEYILLPGGMSGKHHMVSVDGTANSDVYHVLRTRDPGDHS